MSRVNLNKLAKDIAMVEGKKVQVNIAQIKEIMKATLLLLAEKKGSEILEVVERTKEKYSGRRA